MSSKMVELVNSATFLVLNDTQRSQLNTPTSSK